MRTNPADYANQWFAQPNYVPSGSTLQAYNAFSVAGGALQISARPTPANTYANKDNLPAMPYVSGQLTTAHKFTQRYGYYELRAKVPPGSGLWPRFWMLTDDGDWPGAAEYDIFEVLGRTPDITYQTTHFKDSNGNLASDGFHYTGIKPFDGQFHTYGFLWQKTGVTWYVDGVATLNQVNRVDIPMYVLIDLAVGNDPQNLWTGNPNASNVWPAVMEIDYFRVYSNDPALPSATPGSGYSPSTLPNGLSVIPMATVGPMPSGWVAGDIGSNGVIGSSTWNPVTGEWILKGSGYDNRAHFAGTSLTGDGAVSATVQSITRMGGNEVRAGVDMRVSTAEGAQEISFAVIANNSVSPATTRLTLQSRSGKSVSEFGSISVPSGPVNIRLKRQGTLFVGSYSLDGGASWRDVGSVISSTVLGTLKTGLIISGNIGSDQRLARAIFNNVVVQ